MIAGTWGAPMPQEPGPERDQWLRVRGWESYEERRKAMEEAAFKEGGHEPRQGFRCAVQRCPILADPGRERCPEPEMLCEYVRCSIDPEDMPTFEEWVAEYGGGSTR